MLRFDPRKSPQNLGQVMAHGLCSCIFIARVYSSYDSAVLIDQRQHGFRIGEGELAHPVHVGLDVMDSLPSQRAACALGQSNVEQLVVTLKGLMVVPSSGLLLHFKKIVDPLPALLVE